jgi:dolichyl-diphosphooligosaccharide--protein glycosyltransferase
MIDIKEIEEKLATENLKKHRTWPILLGIFLIGFSIRYITRHELLFDPDSYWWYQLAMYFADIRTEHFIHVDGKTIYELAYYPTGRVIDNELRLLPFSIGASYKFLGFLGAPQTPEGLLNYMFFFGPFFGALTAVLAYFLGRELTDSHRAGFIAATFYSFAYFAMTRNTAGDTGQESLGTFWLFVMLYLFVLAVKQGTWKRQAGYATASGISFFLAANTWGGTWFYWGLLDSVVLIYLLVNVFTNRPIERYKSICVCFSGLVLFGIFMPSLLPISKGIVGTFSIGNKFQNLSYFTLLACLLLLGYERLAKKRKITLQPWMFFTAAFGAVIVFLLITGKIVIIHRILDFIHDFVFTPEEKGITGNTVAYYRSVGYAEFKSTFGALLIAIPAGFFLLGYEFYKKRDFVSLFMIFFMILGIVAFRWMIRLSFFLAFILPLYVGYLFARYVERKRQTSRKKKKGIEVQSISRFRWIVAFSVLLFLITPNLVSSLESLKGQKLADTSVTPWKDVGEWIKKNTPENALLIHWWDYGYHLQTFAERRTIVDGGNTGKNLTNFGNRNIDVAKAFTSPEDEFYEYLKPYNPDDLPIYVLVSIEEFGKSGAINYHANDELFITSFSVPNSGNPEQDQKTISDILQRNQITTYYVINYGSYYLIWALIQVDREGNYHPEWSEKVLAKLLPFNTGYGQGMKHFQLVYQNGYVYVYKYMK